ncbi:nidogen-like isoform X4 [Dermacentor albipictus]|uniref:nidogen-like isoform X4 n=1 Tax=Dermacentor albipictus TaxID=60249 RepID=UPI0038FBEBF8
MQHWPSCRLDSACPRDVVALLLLLLAVREVTPAAYIHQACDSDADCASVANTFCKGKECICLPKFSRSYPPCNKGIELGESCSRHENCEVNDNNSYCHHSICRCKPLFRRVLLVSENITRCRRGHEPRESCYNVEDCNGSNYTCYEGLCRCHEGFYKDEETDGCRPRRYLDETCARDSDCDSLVNNSYCSGDHCECKNGYIREGVLPDEQQCEIVPRTLELEAPGSFQLSRPVPSICRQVQSRRNTSALRAYCGGASGAVLGFKSPTH